KDYRITLPNGEVVLLQYRTEGDYPSLDICFERQRVINPFMADLSPAVKLSKARDVDERLCAELFRHGAYDVLVEPYSGEELLRVLEAAAAKTYMSSLRATPSMPPPVTTDEHTYTANLRPEDPAPERRELEAQKRAPLTMRRTAP
ncbi:MAG TPA: hypothetical protein PLP04_16520, partial [Bryobacteraceae bacterium]|nr:hypothetical protein [Bryobacteraceae bacterium]